MEIGLFTDYSFWRFRVHVILNSNILKPNDSQLFLTKRYDSGWATANDWSDLPDGYGPDLFLWSPKPSSPNPILGVCSTTALRARHLKIVISRPLSTYKFQMNAADQSTEGNPTP